MREDERALGKVPPYLITTRDMIRTAAERWKYRFRSVKDFPPGSEPHLIGLKLDALDGETATVADVNAIVTEVHRHWFTRLECHQCGQETDAVVVVGEKRDWESCTADLCVSCALSVAKLVHDLVPSHKDPENKED